MLMSWVMPRPAGPLGSPGGLPGLRPGPRAVRVHGRSLCCVRPACRNPHHRKTPPAPTTVSRPCLASVILDNDQLNLGKMATLDVLRRVMRDSRPPADLRQSKSEDRGVLVRFRATARARLACPARSFSRLRRPRLVRIGKGGPGLKPDPTRVRPCRSDMSAPQPAPLEWTASIGSKHPKVVDGR